MSEPAVIWETPAVLGEGPLWVARENAIYWVDIVNRNLHRLSLEDLSRRSWSFEEGVTSLAPRDRGGFVATIRDGFAFLDLESETLESIVLPEADLPGNRFNDGKIDPSGRYWAGTMDEGEVETTGALYRLDPDLRLHEMGERCCITNGPTFSPDGNVMYHTSTLDRTIFAFDLADDGGLANRRVFVQLKDDAEGYPDGMTTDAEGFLWLCHFKGARMTRYAPTGEVSEIVRFPVPNITSCAFGGDDLKTLYITTARLHMDEESIEKHPLAGSLFRYRPNTPGWAAPNFKG